MSRPRWPELPQRDAARGRHRHRPGPALSCSSTTPARCGCRLALAYYGITVLALFRIVPVTLTLAGIAAFVLSVGMAVDANILIFERTKEELRAGRPLVSAIEAGSTGPGTRSLTPTFRAHNRVDPYFPRIGHDQGLCPGPDHRRGDVLVHGHHRLPHPSCGSSSSRASPRKPGCTA